PRALRRLETADRVEVTSCHVDLLWLWQFAQLQFDAFEQNVLRERLALGISPLVRRDAKNSCDLGRQRGGGSSRFCVGRAAQSGPANQVPLAIKLIHFDAHAGAGWDRFLEYKNGLVRLADLRVDAPGSRRIAVDRPADVPPILVEIGDGRSD